EVHRYLLKIFVQVLERADPAEISALLTEETMLMGNSDEQRAGILEKDEPSHAYVLSDVTSEPPHDNQFLSVREGLKPFRQRHRSRDTVFDHSSTPLDHTSRALALQKSQQI